MFVQIQPSAALAIMHVADSRVSRARHASHVCLALGGLQVMLELLGSR